MKRVKRFLTALLCVCMLAGVMAPAASAVTVLTIINLTVDAPGVGKKPSTTASVPSHARSSVQKVEWSGELDSSGAFKAGVRYKVTVTMGIKKGEDCKFSDKSIDAKVNTKAADEVLWYADDKVEVIYTFPTLAEAKAPTVLKEAKIGLTAPETGKVPAKTATVPSSADYTVKKVTWTGTLSGGKFKADTSYTANITLGIKSGRNAAFSDDTFDAYVNDYLIDEVTWNSATEIVIPVVFEKTGAATTAAPTVLQEARITLTAPETGKTPAKTATVPSGADYTVKKVEWEGALSGGKFKENTSYTAYVTLGIKSGRNATFSDKGFNAYVNGQLMDEILWNSDTEIVVYGVFEKTGAAQTTSSTVIKEARISLTGPEAGKTPATTATVPSGADYTVKKVTWKGSLSSGKFKANTTYTATITLGIKSGKKAAFSDDTFDAYVNGVLMDEITWNSATEIVITAEFEKTGAATTSPTKLNKIQLTVDAPAAMKKPATTASLPSTARSTVQKVEWSGQLDTDGTFMARIKYKVTVTLGIKAGENCVFSDKSINATVNGKAADEVLWYADDKVEVIYTFPAFGTGNTVNTAYITMDGPAAGEKPATTAHLASTDSTYVSNIRWEGALDSSGRFQAGTVYTAYLTLKIKDEFKDRKFSTKSFDAYINGVLMDEVTRVSDREMTIAVEFEKTPGAQPPAAKITFGDVPENAYYAVPVSWAVDKGITGGNNGLFKPQDLCSQAHILTFLWRSQGSPEPKGTMTIEGLDMSKYYAKAALWAAEEKIITDWFDAQAPCTRAQAVTYMWKLAGSPSASAANFPDVPSGSDYAKAVDWALEKGVTGGNNGLFEPGKTCTRANIVTFLHRGFAN